jgi:hypothetical protein
MLRLRIRRHINRECRKPRFSAAFFGELERARGFEPHTPEQLDFIRTCHIPDRQQRIVRSFASVPPNRRKIDRLHVIPTFLDAPIARQVEADDDPEAFDRKFRKLVPPKVST